MSILPKSILGKWSLGLIIAFFVFLLIGMLVVATGEQGGETIFDNLKISIPMLSSMACAIAALIIGLVSIIKSKERSVVVFLATFIGLLVFIFLFGEIVSPH